MSTPEILIIMNGGRVQYVSFPPGLGPLRVREILQQIEQR
jgi:hypothetical protein